MYQLRLPCLDGNSQFLLNQQVAVRNIAATTTAKKGFYLDEFAFRLSLPGARTGFAFTD